MNQKGSGVRARGGAEIAIPQPEPEDLARLAAGSAAVVLVSASALLGGMAYLVSALAIALATLVVRKPAEAIPAGLLFMLAATVLLPSEARLRFIDARYDQMWQMYFWAAGSLVIAMAAIIRIGLAPLFRAPIALRAFLVVAIASSVFGFAHGNEASYVIRQLYGAVLFVVYFVIAQAVGDEELLFRRLKVFGVLLALAFILYYASVFGEFGFHKEDTSVTSQMGMLAVFLAAKGLGEKRSSWLLSAGIMFGASLLFFMRHMVLTFLFALALVFAIRSATRMRRVFFLVVALLIWLPSTFPSSAQVVLDQLARVPGLYELLPANTGDTSTLTSRNLELLAAGATLVKSPVFGAGMGSQLAWDDPALGFVEQAFVDNGWAYVMVKMGVLGIVAFVWLLIAILGCMSRRSLAVSISLLAIVLIMMFSEPVFFQFTTSPIAGALAGMLYREKHPGQELYGVVPARR